MKETFVYIKKMLFCLLFTHQVFSQFYSNHNNNIKQNFKDLSNNFVLLSLNYKPSQEDGATLSYLRLNRGIQVYSVFLTRGEGSENESGSEFYEELGSVKSNEAKQVSRIIKNNLYYLNFVDPGYTSKIDNLINKFGGKDSILSQMVYIIRKLKPDVILIGEEFPYSCKKSANDQIIASLLPEAIIKAADKNYRSGDISVFLFPWNVKRVFQKMQEKATGNNFIEIPVNNIDADVNQSYIRIAINALKNYKSESYNIIADKVLDDKNRFYLPLFPKNFQIKKNADFFNGINISVTEKNFEMISKNIKNILETKTSERNKLLELITLADINLDQLKKTLFQKKDFNPLSERVLTSLKFKLSDLKANALGIKIKKFISDSVVAQHQVFFFRIDTILNLSPGETRMMFLNVNDDWAILRENEYKNNFLMRYGIDFQIVTPKKHPVTFPHHIYQYDRYNEDPQLKYVILHKAIDPKFSFQYFDFDDFEVIDKAEFKVFPKNVLMKDKRTFNFRMQNYLYNKYLGIMVKLSNNEFGDIRTKPFDINAKYQKVEGDIEFTLSDSIKNGVYDLDFNIGKTSSKVRIKKFECEIDTTAKVGLIKSEKNIIEKFLVDLRVNYKNLDSEYFEDEKLNQFSTIIIDENLLFKNNYLFEKNNKLLEYVNNGGNLVVLSQHNLKYKNSYSIFSPFKIDLFSCEIADEFTNIQINDNYHPFFNYPNKISSDDLKDWVKNKGIHLPMDYARDYQELITLSTPDLVLVKSGILYVRYGKGTYTYTPLLWLNQLEEVNVVAYRLFSNLISQKRSK